MKEKVPLSGRSHMDKEMEKKRSPAQGRGRKGKMSGERNANAAAEPDGAGIATPDEYSRSFKSAEINARIARKAYELFERRGHGTGSDLEDWLTAEQLVKEEIARANS
jgi:hypothetical protein